MESLASRFGRRLVAVGTLASLSTLAGSVSAQEIRVEETAGVAQGSGQATLSLHAEAGQQIAVRRVTEQMSAQVTSNFGYNASAYGDVSAALCVTPCKLSLPTGFYKLRFGDYNPMNANTPIDFNLGPGDNVYRVRPFSGGKFVSGFLLTLLGGSAAIVGGTMAIVKKDGKAPFAVMAGLGAGVTIGGIVLLAGAGASVERQ
jgi:hypothetical protein